MIHILGDYDPDVYWGGGWIKPSDRFLSNLFQFIISIRTDV
jgi:hypothetical protein